MAATVLQSLRRILQRAHKGFLRQIIGVGRVAGYPVTPVE
jgi:hypothetical protein